MRKMILIDRFLTEWKQDESYQEIDTSAPGWLAYRHPSGEVMSFGDLLQMRGFDPGPLGDRYLRARLADETDE